MTPPYDQPVDDTPVEFWPTASIRAALQSGDITVWQRIVVAVKRDPYGRTARQVEEVLESAAPYGVSHALHEVLTRARSHLEANERTEAARHVQILRTRSGLSDEEFASRIGVSGEEFAAYLDATVSPAASLMIRMRRLSDRFAKIRAQQATSPTGPSQTGPSQTGPSPTGPSRTGPSQTDQVQAIPEADYEYPGSD